jgi:GNAT superfamily N-acetyltransferase
MSKLSRRDFAAIGLSTLFVGRSRHEALRLRSDIRRDADIVIRPFTPKDAEAVGRIVDADYRNDADKASSLYAINRALHLPAEGGNVWRAALVAEQNGAVIGAGSSRSLPMSRHTRTHVIVAASHRRQGVGTRLYREVASLVRAEGRTPIASIAAREATAFAFATSVGMQPLMRSRQLTVDLTSWAVDLWCRNAVRQPSPYTFVTSAQVTPEVFFGALGAAYHYMHERWSDIQAGTLADYRATWSGRVSENSGVIALDGDRVIGVGNYFASGAVERAVFVFPTGVCRALPSLDHERSLTARLLADRLLAARASGNRQAILEFDDDDGRLLQVMASIPVSTIYETFTLTAGPTSHWPGRS